MSMGFKKLEKNRSKLVENSSLIISDNLPKLNRRLNPEQRSKDIVVKAIEYFSEVGFDGSTRELAKRLGVTQPLLYRYFPTKEDLIQQVYNTVFVGRWKEEWEILLENRSKTLQDRLLQFYESYTETIFDPRWIRIYLFAGLRGFDVNKWYVSLVERKILRRICVEYRHELGLPKKKQNVTSAELEATWTLHGGIFYYGVRKHIYSLPVTSSRKDTIKNAVETFIIGGERIFRNSIK